MSKNKISAPSDRFRSVSPSKKAIIKHPSYNKFNLCEACCEGRIDDIKNYFERTSKSARFVDKKDIDGFSPLHYAVRYNYIQVVKCLIFYGANTNIRSSVNGVTPLHLAAQYKSNNSQPSTRPSLTNPSEESKDFTSSPLFEDVNLLTGDKVHKKSKKNSNEFKNDPIESPVFLPLFKKSKYPMFSALESNELQNDSIIKVLISNGADINARDKKDATPLHYAAMRRNSQAVEELLTYPILNIECKDSAWMTPLHYAAEQGCMSIARLLISNGADITALNHFDMTPLHIASDEGHPEVAELLITNMEAVNKDKLMKYINSIDSHSKTALHNAALAGNDKVTNILLNFGADPYITTLEKSSSPLHLACISGSYEVVQLLVEHYPSLVNMRDSDNETPLHISSRLNREAIVKYLLTKTLEIDCFDRDLRTPLVLAAQKDHLNIVKILLEKGADLMNRDSNDFSALHVAALNNSLKCAELFLHSQSSYSLQNSWDYHENRPIHLAVENNNIEMVKLLLTESAPIDSKNDLGLTPFLIASVKGYTPILKLILGFSPALALDQDDSNNTALHHAALNGHYRLITTLINSGINIDARNSEQLSALDLAADKNHVKVAYLLIEHDATIEPSETSMSMSPLMVACQNGHSEMVTLLLNNGADVNREDSRGRNCLEVAIDENRRAVALSIINSKNWEQALRHVSRYNDSNCSPFRRLIHIMPEVAEVVLDKCLTNNCLPLSHPVYELHCNYEYLEDQHFEWGKKLNEIYYEDFIPNKNENIILHYIRRSAWFLRNLIPHSNSRDHPLSLIVEKRRVDLIKHPLTRYLIRYKWKTYASYVYFVRLLSAALFIVFLTSFCILTATPPYACTMNATDPSPPHPLNSSYVDDLTGCFSCPLIPEPPDILNAFFVSFGKYFIFIMAVLSILSRVLVIMRNPDNLTSAQNQLELIGSLFAVLFISGSFTIAGRPLELIPFYRCTNYFRSIGALSLCFSWISFILLLSKVPKIGIYVVMYSDIFRTFVQFMPIYFMLLLSFAFPFYLLFLDRYSTNSFINPGKAIMKTFLGMVGEVEYDTFYNTSNEPALPVAYIILFIYLLSNSIILMNLLVGLAVDDIQGVQSNAFLTRLGLQVHTAMEMETIFPKFIQDRILIFDQTIFPNKSKTHSFWSLWQFKANPFTDNKEQSSTYEKSVESSFKDIKDEMKVLKHQIKTISEKNLKIELMLEELLKRGQKTS